MRKTKKVKPAGVMYSTDGKGRWWRREWKRQCPNEVFPYGECQGVHGHKDVHWCFNASGSFCWQDNDSDPRHDGCAGSTPPGHKQYRSPIEMEKHHYMDHYRDTEVRDPAIIQKLERDKPPESGASINRPVSAEEMKRLGLESRLRDLKRKKRRRDRKRRMG